MSVVGPENFIIDDTDLSINYTGLWESGNDTQNSFDYNGSCHFSNDPNATATWQFTGQLEYSTLQNMLILVIIIGIAFYYIAPLWAFPVNTSINIDDNITQTIDLENYTATALMLDNSAESDPYAVLWESGLLENTSHTVVLSMATGGQYVIVDAFGYRIFMFTAAANSPDEV
jgi:hypothetical protein